MKTFNEWVFISNEIHKKYIKRAILNVQGCK